MLFKVATLEEIKDGRITLAFRRWQRPTVTEGTGLRTAIGVVRIGAVDPVEAATESEALAAGYVDVAALETDLRSGAGRQLYRIAILGVETDHRIALRETKLTEADDAALRDRFARWEKSSPGYYPAILLAIADAPATSSVLLAKRLGVDKAKLKPDIRKLKELGLTESLEVGYRLSPRGEAALRMLDESGE